MLGDRTVGGVLSRLLRGRVGCLALLVIDIAAFWVSLLGLIMSIFLWDDPHPDHPEQRVVVTLLLLAAPFLIGGSAVLLVWRLVKRRPPGWFGWMSMLPACAILAAPA